VPEWTIGAAWKTFQNFAYCRVILAILDTHVFLEHRYLPRRTAIPVAATTGIAFPENGVLINAIFYHSNQHALLEGWGQVWYGY